MKQSICKDKPGIMKRSCSTAIELILRSYLTTSNCLYGEEN